MSDVAASGGYYISAGANKIIAEPSTITGSIGVVAGKPVVKGFYDWLGITNQYVTRGEAAGMFRETEKFDDKVERPRFIAWVNTTYDDFISKVARGRHKEKTEIDKIGQGRVWTGAQGKENGIVDEYGGLDRAIEVAKQLANIPADKGVHRVIFPYPRTFIQQLLSSGDDDAGLVIPEAVDQIFGHGIDDVIVGFVKLNKMLGAGHRRPVRCRRDTLTN